MTHFRKIPPFFLVLFTTTRKFFYDKCTASAASLSMYTLISIVPIAAFLLFLATFFDIKSWLELNVENNFAYNSAVTSNLITFANNLIEVAHTKYFGVVSISVIAIISARFIAHIELVLNQIWRVDRKRPFLKKCIIYMMITILSFLLFTTSSSLSISLVTRLSKMIYQNHLPEDFFFIGKLGLQTLPYLIIFFIVFIYYLYIPYTRVDFKAAVYGALITAIVYQTVHIVYFHLQIFLNRYNAIYGTFASLPIFILWLYISWSIFLYGAQMVVVIENVPWLFYFMKKDSLSTYFKTLLFLLVLAYLAKYSNTPEKSSMQSLKKELGIPPFLLHEIFQKLVAKSWLKYRLFSSPFNNRCTLNEQIKAFSLGQILESLSEKEISLEKSLINTTLCEKIASLENLLNQLPSEEKASLPLTKLFDEIDKKILIT